MLRYLTKQIIITFLAILFIIVFFSKKTYSTSSVNIETVAGLTEDDIDITNITDQVEGISELNGPFIANAFAQANILGYPIGKAYIGSFPHFELGVSIGAGCTNMKYFDDNDPASEDGSLPGIALNPVLHIGIGLFGGFDVLGKIFYLSKSIQDPGLEYDIATLSDFMIYSAGCKIRYNIIKKKTILPFIFSFGGITLSLGGDVFYGNVKITGEYDYIFSDIDIEVGPISNSINMNFDGNFETTTSWSVYSVTAQAIAYFDIFYLFSIYSGLGLTGGYGFFDSKFIGTGDLVTDNEDYINITGEENIGNILFTSKNNFTPFPVIPTFILGLEINILIIKLNFETMVNLHNGRDINLLCGARIQI